jgi:hypothetical protein
VAREAIHAYLTDQVRRLEDLEDELAIARYQLRKQLGEVTYVSQAEARPRWGSRRRHAGAQAPDLRDRLGRRGVRGGPGLHGG